MKNWYLSLSRQDRWLVPITGVLLLAMVVGVLYCRFRQLPPAVGVHFIQAERAFACDDSDNCITPIVLLSGQIGPHSAEVLKDVESLVEQYGISTVCFDSPGGDNVAAIKLAEGIEKKNLDTCLATKYLDVDGKVITTSASCHSACPWVFLSGLSRTAFSKSALFGFHASTSWLAICKCQVWQGNGDSEVYAFAKNIEERNQRRGEVSHTEAQFRLLQWSFEVGPGPTQQKPLATLLNEYEYLTSIKGEAPK